ncbi:hypothetical protein FNV43_RR13488 [Rhamnella rubrinervis]|uniref:Uncharacterized protein n=1 Tax=Rhamnella rubrinervis TaxID=2594499 RepID=A0A8K0MFE6_9ROSA|nr:hypothetical protein FNV43_RR13488 [Rhamnella rubrinervis]
MASREKLVRINIWGGAVIFEVAVQRFGWPSGRIKWRTEATMLDNLEGEQESLDRHGKVLIGSWTYRTGDLHLQSRAMLDVPGLELRFISPILSYRLAASIASIKSLVWEELPSWTRVGLLLANMLTSDSLEEISLVSVVTLVLALGVGESASP